MKYFPIPLAMLEIGRPLPVDVWSGTGQLLLRKGQLVASEQHRERLAAHQAASTLPDALAWQRAYERMVHTMLRDGVDLQEIARAPMPSIILERDYVEVQQLQGGWLDLQEVLRGILYQGGLAIHPLARLEGIQAKALALLEADPDDSLFCLFQALADPGLGYCATHALLCAVVCHLTASKLGLPPSQAQLLVLAAITMNIGMARDQDSMARQNTALTDWQRRLVSEHPEISVEILSNFGVDDDALLDLVRWHHGTAQADVPPQTQTLRRTLSMADSFVAKMASRTTRAPMSPVRAVKTMVMAAEGDALGIGSAMAQAVGFYPPGTYVQLANTELAVTVQRGVRANTPWVVSLVNQDGMPIADYRARDTSNPAYAIAAAVTFEKVRILVNLDKVRKARATIPR